MTKDVIVSMLLGYVLLIGGLLGEMFLGQSSRHDLCVVGGVILIRVTRLIQSASTKPETK